MDSLLKPIEPDVLKKMFLSDDLTTDFIKNKEYSTDPNVICVANVLLSYYMNMNQVNNMLSNYSSMVTNEDLSPEKKADIKLRIQLLTYVSMQKIELDKVDNNKIIDSILKKTGKKSRRKVNRSKRSRTKRSRTKRSRSKKIKRNHH
jgi:hypothetical protein